MGNFYQAVAANKSKPSGLLLDQFFGAAAAYSLRKLRRVYTGEAVEVYNGSSYADIGFLNDELNTTALAAHCGSNDGFVSKWYDQSGNSNTAAQTVTGSMPKIYDGTTGVLTENGKPAIRFSSVSNGNFTTSVSVSTPFTFSAVYIPSQSFALALPGSQLMTNGSRNCMVLSQNTTPGDNVEDKQVGVIAVGDGGSSSASSFYDTAQPSEVAFTYDSALDVSFLGNRNAVTAGRCSLQEFIAWGENQDSTNRTGIETNINIFYSIY